jgi:hypothetical protein
MVYLTRKINQKPYIWTFGQFDHLVNLTIWSYWSNQTKKSGNQNNLIKKIV